MGDGIVTALETEMLKYIGSWVKANSEMIYDAMPADIEAENADILVNGEDYYAVVRKVPMTTDINVARAADNIIVKVKTGKTIVDATWLDDGAEVTLLDGQTFSVAQFFYGTSAFARVAKFKLQ
jgi:hypothetical protein